RHGKDSVQSLQAQLRRKNGLKSATDQSRSFRERAPEKCGSSSGECGASHHTESDSLRDFVKCETESKCGAYSGGSRTPSVEHAMQRGSDQERRSDSVQARFATIMLVRVRACRAHRIDETVDAREQRHATGRPSDGSRPP